jgi:hypothetical protein
MVVVQPVRFIEPLTHASLELCQARATPGVAGMGEEYNSLNLEYSEELKRKILIHVRHPED